MKPGGGKGKGSAFEREIAKALSLWLTRGTDSTQLIRSVLSGGWVGREAEEGFRQVGDLAPNGWMGERFRRCYGVECKHQRDVSLWQLWTGGKLIEWWDKLSKEAGAASVTPLLVVRENRRPTTIFAPEWLFAVDRWPWPEQLEKFAPIRHRLIAPWRKMIAFPLDELLQCDPIFFIAPK